jgi:subtilase family serine protease
MTYIDGLNNPIQGSIFQSIAPGKSINWTIHPYGNPFKKYNDLPGKHEFKVVLDPDKKLIGENSSNNTFTETINLY